MYLEAKEFTNGTCSKRHSWRIEKECKEHFARIICRAVKYKRSSKVSSLGLLQNIEGLSVPNHLSRPHLALPQSLMVKFNLTAPLPFQFLPFYYFFFIFFFLLKYHPPWKHAIKGEKRFYARRAEIYADAWGDPLAEAPHNGGRLAII